MNNFKKRLCCFVQLVMYFSPFYPDDFSTTSCQVLLAFFQAFRQLRRGTKNGEGKLGCIILRVTFRRMGDNAHTLNLENCLLYLSSIMSQFLDFINCLVFYFIFLLRDNEHTITSNVRSLRENLKPPSWPRYGNLARSCTYADKLYERVENIRLPIAN